MSFSITFFGPSHYWWNWKKYDEHLGRKVRRYWFYKPDIHSTGGIGFCIPGLHIVFCWGREKRK